MANDNLARALDDEEPPPEDALPTADGGDTVVDSTSGGRASRTVSATESGSPEVRSAVEHRTFGADLALIRDIPVKLSMEIGHTRITIEELLKLGAGSIVELERMADEPLDVLVNGTLVAHGEAVVVGDRFGMRLIDVVSPSERLGGVV